MDTLHVHSIYYTFSGEHGMFLQGEPVTIVRLSGCNLSCKWCDTPETQKICSGDPYTVEDVLDDILSHTCENVLITGGEPLLQAKALESLIYELQYRDMAVQIETNGTIRFPGISLEYNPILWRKCSFVVDVKPPSAFTKDIDILPVLKTYPDGTYLKFPVQEEVDFECALEVIQELDFREEMPDFNFSVSPVSPMTPMMVWTKLCATPFVRDVALNVQLHKMIFPEGKKDI